MYSYNVIVTPFTGEVNIVEHKDGVPVRVLCEMKITGIEAEQAATVMCNCLTAKMNNPYGH